MKEFDMVNCNESLLLGPLTAPMLQDKMELLKSPRTRKYSFHTRQCSQRPMPQTDKHHKQNMKEIYLPWSPEDN